LNKLKDENSSTIGEKEEILAQLKNGNSMIRAEIDTINSWMVHELEVRGDTRGRLQELSDTILLKIHNEKDLRLKYQRAAAATFGSHQELHRLKSENEKQGKKLKILIDLLEQSRNHLGHSIAKKNELIEQTLTASD
jgi:superfamily II helicase